MYVREATPGEELDVRRILDAAALETTALGQRVEAGDVLIAVEPHTPSTEPPVRETTENVAYERVLGALVLESRGEVAHVTAVAVRRRRKGRGIGTALVEAALARSGHLSATFDEGVLPFYESLGFDVEPLGDGRFRGVTSADGR